MCINTTPLTLVRQQQTNMADKMRNICSITAQIMKAERKRNKLIKVLLCHTIVQGTAALFPHAHYLLCSGRGMQDCYYTSLTDGFTPVDNIFSQRDIVICLSTSGPPQ